MCQYPNFMKNSEPVENNFSFPSKKHKIRKYKDFQSLFKNSTVLNLSFGQVRIRKNDFDYLRIAISVSKKVSKKSTVRNRIKRICYEFLRLSKNYLKGYDVWVYVKVPVEDIKGELMEIIKNSS